MTHLGERMNSYVQLLLFIETVAARKEYNVKLWHFNKSTAITNLWLFFKKKTVGKCLWLDLVLLAKILILEDS